MSSFLDVRNHDVGMQTGKSFSLFIIFSFSSFNEPSPRVFDQSRICSHAHGEWVDAENNPGENKKTSSVCLCPAKQIFIVKVEHVVQRASVICAVSH